MYTLYIDTHSNKITMVLYKEKKIFYKREENTSLNHSENTMPILIEVLKKANIETSDLNEIIVVNGPGSFTGIRIGVTIAKTLAYTLHIPIKVMSSLLIKAVSFTHDEITIVEREKNGVFLVTFDKQNNVIGEYKYLPNKEYRDLENKEDLKEEVELDYLQILNFANNLESVHPHSVNPLYVKKIEVQK